MNDEQARRVVDAMEHATGTLTGYRRAHARGIVFHARFTPSDKIRDLTTAEHFQGPVVPTLVRLSNGSGNPYASDKRPGNRGAVLGLAVRFTLASGGHSTWSAANLEAFPARKAEDLARTAEEFIALTRRQRSSPRTGEPKTARLLAFLLLHRDLLPAFLVAPDQTRRAFRYSWIPDAGCRELSVRAQREWPPQYLISEIRQRPTASWTLEFAIDRGKVIAGRLELVKPHEDQALVDKLLFDPANVVPGIELSDDPLLHLRSAVYAVSLERRILETRPAVTNE
jgi:catalase